MTNFNFKDFFFSLEDLFKSRGFSADNLHSIDQVYILTGSIKHNTIIIDFEVNIRIYQP
jgi:hypothetical protein